MEPATTQEFDHLFDFELASGPNGLDLNQLSEADNMFAEPQCSQSLSSTALPASYTDLPAPITNCAAPPPADGFDSIAYSHTDELPINVPSFWRPAVPCDYCASRQLQCFFLHESQDYCNACTSLFRACSFENPAARAQRGYLDTLSSVAEDVPQARGLMTSTKPLFSLGASMNDILDDIMKSKPDRSTTRFPRSITLVLRKWLDAHSEHPYPTDEERDELRDQTGLTKNQISNWLANARRRGKVRPKRCVSPSVSAMSRSRPIDIPSGLGKGRSQSHLTPFERWKESPPEHEPASLSAITQAARHVPFNPADSGSTSQTHSVAEHHRSSTSAGSAFHAPSVSSLETGRSGRSSGSLASTNGSSHSYGSRSSYTSYGGRDRRRRRRNVPKTQKYAGSGPEKKIFQCTFCTDTFGIKYDWSRHEKSLHLSLEKWRCAPLGPIVTSTADGSTQCVYCQLPNPTKSHAEEHHHSECEEKGKAARTFFRKDHLRQHLRLIHNVPLSPNMEAWRSAPDVVRSRCGFCPEDKPTTFTTWQDRADHLARHFREGAQMTQWKGDWGFDPEIAAQVTNAMPPWMIGEEAKSLDPFTATSTSSGVFDNVDVHRENIDVGEFPLGRATQGKISTCWEVLTVLLGQFVRTRMQAGEEVSDRTIQRQARIILYDDDDEWNQTAADNAEWLRIFKKTHGIADGQMALPNSSGAVGTGKNRHIQTNSSPSTLNSPQKGGLTVDGGGGGSGCGLSSSDLHDEEDLALRQAFEDAAMSGMTFGASSEPHASYLPASTASPTSSIPAYLLGDPWSMPLDDEIDFNFDHDFTQ